MLEMVALCELMAALRNSLQWTCHSLNSKMEKNDSFLERITGLERKQCEVIKWFFEYLRDAYPEEAEFKREYIEPVINFWKAKAQDGSDCAA